MAAVLQGKRVAFLATDGVEEVEYAEPRKAVESTGGTAELLSLASGEIQAVNHMDKAGSYPVDKTVRDADPDEYDALVLPRGVANPDLLRADADAVRFIREFVSAGKPVAAICHAPLDYHDILGSTTATMIDVLKGSPYQVMDRQSLAEACDDAGISKSTYGVWTTYAEWMERFGPSVWGLRGSSPNPAAVEAIRRAATARLKAEPVARRGRGP